jgi:formaldehyde-activating enzyme involved in methanogenesis
MGQIGESFVAKGAEAAHVNTVPGERRGPAGAPVELSALAGAAAAPSTAQRGPDAVGRVRS